MNQLVDQFGNPYLPSRVDNSFGGGAYQFNPFGFPQNQQSPNSARVENVDTIFHNLRWLLVSNLRQILNQAYVEIGLVQTIVDVPCDDAFRGGIIIKSQEIDEDQIEELQISLDRDNDLGIVCQAQKWNRLFGGAGVIILTDQDPEEPLDINLIGSDTPLEFRSVDMWELFWDKQNTEGYDPSIQTQNFEFYSYYGEKLHKSRVMKLKGFEAPSFIRPRLRGWGFSVIEVLVRSINQYLKATDLGFEVLDEFKIDVFKIKNLVNTLLSPNGAAKIQQRVQQANYQKNFQKALVMDSEDDWDHKQLNFAGLAETMAGIRMQVAADMRMPITKLFGTSASAGLGNTDQNDMENYNSMVESQVRNKAKYDVLRVCEIKCQKLFGMIPDDLSIEFKPLRVLSALDEETVKTQKFNRIAAAQSTGMITTYEYREACNKGNIFDITLDTSGDVLNPDDPEVQSIVKEGVQNPTDSKDDIDDPGANRADTMKVRATDKGGIVKGTEKPKDDNDPSVENSLEFEKKSYEADQGDSWFDPRREEFFKNPKDKNLWDRCLDESKRAYGRDDFAFALWLYKKRAGRF